MNEYFDTRRFGKYLSYTVKSDIKRFGIILVAVLGTLLFAFLIDGLFFEEDYSMGSISVYDSFGSEADPMGALMIGWMWFVFIVFSFYFSTLVFASLSSKDGRITQLMVPASQLEKYLSRWLIYCPIAVGLLLLGFETIDVIRYVVLKIKFPDCECIHLVVGGFYSGITSDMRAAVAVGFVLMQSFGVLISSIWPKNSFGIAVVVIVIINACIGLYSALMSYLLLSGENMYYGMMNADEYETLMKGVMLAIGICMTITNYAVAYYRFREIEIVQRW